MDIVATEFCFTTKIGFVAGIILERVINYPFYKKDTVELISSDENK